MQACGRGRVILRDDTRWSADGGADASRVLMLTTFDLNEYVYDALRAGASGFLLKDVQLAEGIRVVAGGDALLAPSITRRLIQELATARPAAELIVSETTVKTHVARTLMKLGIRDRVQAVVLAYEAGIAVPGQAAP
jgi:DNA-binding NarL/FixJ family response regulator